MDFQMISTKNFEDEARFSRTFAKMFLSVFHKADAEGLEGLLEPVTDFVQNGEEDSLGSCLHV